MKTVIDPDTHGVSQGAQHAHYERPPAVVPGPLAEVRQVESKTEVSDGAATTLEVEFLAPRTGQAYLVERITLVSDGACACEIYVGSVDDGSFVDYAANAARAVADELSPIFVPSGAPLIARFTGVVLNQRCTANIQYRRIGG